MQTDFFDTTDIFTVTLLTERISYAVSKDLPQLIKLKGEVSNLKIHSSGHIYFSLKDENAQINAIIWRSIAGKLRDVLENGMELLVEGSIDFYPPSGRYQIICKKASPVGLGFLQKEFDQLFSQLKTEGLFEDSYKLPLPKYPGRVGLVTSPTGAVLQDIRSSFHRRYPGGELILYPSLVQGDRAPEEIAEGIRYFNQTNTLDHKVDAIILARGGGTLEDLWAFNTEVVARAIFNSQIPIVSGVGHETDISISDMVSDARAGTPSIAAELLSFDSHAVKQSLQTTITTIQRIISTNNIYYKQRLESLLQSHILTIPIKKVDFARQQSENLFEQIKLITESNFSETKLLLSQLKKRIKAMSMVSTLNRGYVAVLKKNKYISHADKLKKGDTVSVLFSDGTKKATIS